MKNELLALVILILLVLGLPTAALGYQAWRSNPADVRVIDLEAQLPEQGGFAPDIIRIQAGEPVRLRIHSPDVLHSFAIGRTNIGPVDIVPGKVTEVEFSIDEPGIYSFFCARWCSTNHWRMRGTIEVLAADGSLPSTAGEPAPYIALGVDLDAWLEHGNIGEHQATPQLSVAPAAPPTASRAAGLDLTLPPIGVADTPISLFESLQAAYPTLTDTNLWDLVALAWLQSSNQEEVELGQQLYDRDCAACHGLDGRGGGVMARDLPEAPHDWTNPVYLLNASDAFLHGKIVRGGMGTGMPGWGEVYSEEQNWALVSFLRTFVFIP